MIKVQSALKRLLCYINQYILGGMGIDKPPRMPANSESAIIERFGLTCGNRVAFEKVAVHAHTSVPAGSVAEGVIQGEVRIGEPIHFDSGATISDVRRIEERDGELFVDTATSTYRLRSEGRSQEETLTVDDVEMVETAKGSSYRYLPDGTTQRFKKVEGREYEPQDALVYVPDYAWVKKHAPTKVLEILGENETIYVQNLLEWTQNPYKDGRKVYIVDKAGNHIETNEKIKNAEGPIYLAFVREEGGPAEFVIPVSHTPKLHFMTYDVRHYTDEKTGEYMRDRHLGNEVVRIVTKENKDQE